ncbi:hypothetical protein FRUB_03150 [Fimbriiglobus ruber]|uniref:VanZ-like domain-containing protein n=1 Tax=Fimbriiglobus ruber TaxID=1908690 RepID=A0A225DQI3_9BACT|nr:hypothetical protein FRUB_03150 [Fimbriiglobus ruber]
MAFTIYGSYVPFHYHYRPWDEIRGAFLWALEERIHLESRSDMLANVMLGVPLGFGLLGAARVDRTGFGRSVMVALLIWPLCTLFATVVEFFQLYFPGRTCSSLDIIAQSSGAVIGLVGWLVVGQTATNRIRRAWSDPRAGGVPGQFLLAYLGLVLLIQLLPLDLTLSPANVYHKIRANEVTATPFAEWKDPHANHWTLLETGLDLVGLFLPVGLIAARLPGRIWRSPWGLPVVVLCGIVIGLVTEAGQLFVSRHPSTTDALFACAGTTLGWIAARISTRNDKTGISLEAALIFGQLWLAVLVFTHWHPFNFGHPAPSRFASVEWVPFSDAAEKNYLGALDLVLERLVLFAPFGVLVTAVGLGPVGRGRIAGGCVLGLTAAFVLEAGQYFLPTRNPSTTDVVTAGIGALCGAVFARQARAVVREPRSEYEASGAVKA